MINTHYSQYRMISGRQPGKDGRYQEKTVDRQSRTIQRKDESPDNSNNSRKGNKFDEFA